MCTVLSMPTTSGPLLLLLLLLPLGPLGLSHQLAKADEAGASSGGASAPSGEGSGGPDIPPATPPLMASPLCRGSGPSSRQL